MGLFDFLFKRTDCGKHTVATCRLLNSIRRQNPTLTTVATLLRVVIDRYGDEDDVTKILANIYDNCFFDEDEFPNNDWGLKFGLMDVVVCCIYFEYGAKPFNQDKYLIGKIGQVMREEGFTSLEINGIKYPQSAFPVDMFTKYLVRKNLTPAYLRWREWM